MSGALAAGLEVEPVDVRVGGWTTEAEVTLRNTGQRGLAPGLLEHRLFIHSGAGTRGVRVFLDVPFALDAGAELTGPCLAMAWRSEPGSAYRVQFSDSLSRLDRRNASDFIIAVDTVTTWTDCRGGETAASTASSGSSDVGSVVPGASCFRKGM